ncbi:MAG: TIM barrel protein [Nanoarchaeota archaeon]
MTIKFGPAGLGSVADAEKVLEQYKKFGFKICEIAFTYSVYIKKEDAKRIGKKAKELGIDLTIHASYFINLNSSEKEKVEASKKRILKCCEIGEELGVKRVVFHPGYYGKMSKEETYKNIKKQIKEILERIQKNNWKIKISPETMGKVNVFGSPEEISQLVKDTGCDFCIDFAHILAREKKVDYGKIKKLFPQEYWHCHFSGIVYGEKGEKHHKSTEKKEWGELLENLPKDKEISIVCESPTLIEDSIEGMSIYEKLK